ncbi:MAG: hypothetical protein JWN37_452 [Candidatus Nomurabacteria bacterium]|nr:hypothetical protein [Candidatus Nomurabacteria bacterium]
MNTMRSLLGMICTEASEGIGKGSPEGVPPEVRTKSTLPPMKFDSELFCNPDGTPDSEE